MNSLPTFPIVSGVDAKAQRYAQTKGTVSRLSNMILSRRGELKTWGGSVVQYYPAASFADSIGSYIDIVAWWEDGQANFAPLALVQNLTSNQLDLINLSEGYSSSAVIATFSPPALNGANPFGDPNGTSGYTSALSQFIQFENSVILLLGNTYAPQLYNGSSVAALNNTYDTTGGGSTPAWQPNTSYNALSNIQAGGYLFRPNNGGGVSGGTAPTWPSTKGATVADGSIIWINIGSYSAPDPRGAAHGIVYGGSLWLWNTYPTLTSDNLDGPSILKMSDLNNANSWNPVNVTGIDTGDGQQGMGMSAFAISEAGILPTQQLILFKEYKTYIVNGVFGASDFYVTRGETDMGCIAPRTIQFVAGSQARFGIDGIFRLTHKGFTVFDGLRDRIISPQIEPYLFQERRDITAANVSVEAWGTSCQLADPPCYVAALPLSTSQGPMTRLFCFDMEAVGWTIIDLPFGIRAMSNFYVKQQASSIQGQQLAMAGGSTDGNVRYFLPQVEAGTEAEWDTGADVGWSFDVPAAFSKSPGNRLFFRRLVLRGSYNGTAPSVPALSASVSIDDATAITVPGRTSALSGGSGIQALFDIGRTGTSAWATVSGNGNFSVVAADWNVQQKPAGVPATIGM
jgi:hypothetical protein